jgi:hypothetical protein
MYFSWSQFVEIAEHLKEQGDANRVPQEAAYRCSVSRAYYGAYRHALNYAKDTGGYIPNNNGTDHAKVRFWYKDKKETEIYRRLNRLHQWRIDCDYNEPFQEIANLSQCACSSITEAQAIIAALK